MINGIETLRLLIYKITKAFYEGRLQHYILLVVTTR